MKRLSATLLLCLLLLTACGTEGKETPPPLSDHPWLDDYELFWDTVEENFALYNAAERINNVDYAEVKEKYRPIAEQAQSAADLKRALSGSAREFWGAGHLYVLDAPPYASHMEIFEQWRGQYPMFQYLYDRISGERSRAFYGYSTQLDKSGGLYAPLDVPELDHSRNLSFSYFLEHGAAQVEIRSMTNGWENDDEEVLAQWFRRIEEAGYTDCILDIRGNQGGDTQFWHRNVVSPNISEGIASQNYVLIKGSESKDYLGVVGLVLNPIEKLPQDELKSLNPDDLEGIECYALHTVSAAPNEKAPLFSGRFWLLVDEKNYSASEAFAVFCKQTGFATLVGTPTAGDGIGISPLLFSLPNSGIVYRFSALNGLNADGSCNEEYGTTPDIEIKVGQDALAACLDAIDLTK